MQKHEVYLAIEPQTSASEHLVQTALLQLVLLKMLRVYEQISTAHHSIHLFSAAQAKLSAKPALNDGMPGQVFKDFCCSISLFLLRVKLDTQCLGETL